MRKIVAFAVLVCLTVAAVAQNAAGTYKGHVKLDRKVFLDGLTGAKRAEIEKGMNEITSGTFTLVLKPNKTFRLTSPPLGKQPVRHSEGKWIQKGNRITLITLSTDNGKGKNDKPLSGFISPNGKTLTLDQGKNEEGYALVFSR